MKAQDLNRIFRLDGDLAVKLIGELTEGQKDIVQALAHGWPHRSVRTHFKLSEPGSYNLYFKARAKLRCIDNTGFARVYFRAILHDPSLYKTPVPGGEPIGANGHLVEIYKCGCVSEPVPAKKELPGWCRLHQQGRHCLSRDPSLIQGWKPKSVIAGIFGVDSAFCHRMIETLTPRQKEVAEKLAFGAGSNEICRAFDFSYSCLSKFTTSIRERMACELHGVGRMWFCAQFHDPSETVESVMKHYGKTAIWRE